MSPVKKIPPRSFHFLIWLLVFASALAITTSCGRSSKPDSKPVVTSEVQNLLNEGNGYTTDGYFKATSSTLVAAAAAYLLGVMAANNGSPQDGPVLVVCQPGR